MVDVSKAVVLVTGGARSIGLAFVEHLLAANAKVAIGDLPTSSGAEVQKALNAKYPGKVIFTPFDVIKEFEFEDAIKTVIKTFGYINVIINNAALCDESIWQTMIKVNVEGVVNGVRLGFKYMSKANGGQGGTVVNISSITSQTPWDPVPIYSGTKGFVSQYTRAAGRPLHFEKTHVKVIGINPGTTDTPLLKQATEKRVGEERKVWDYFIEKYGMQNVDNMGKGLITVLQKAENGTIWLIERNNPPSQVKIEYKHESS